VRRALVAVVVAAVALVACGGDDGGAEPAVVTVETFEFGPDPITVAAGTTIRFVNEDSTTHTATAGTREAPEPGTFDVELVEGGEGEVTLGEAGTYDYFCSIHDGPGMTARIEVT
jgi:plastocyanin